MVVEGTMLYAEMPPGMETSGRDEWLRTADILVNFGGLDEEKESGRL